MVAEADVLTTLPTDVDRAYRAYMTSHFGDLSDPQGLALTMWNAGGRNAIAAMVEFGDVLPRLSRIETRIGAIKALLGSMAAVEVPLAARADRDAELIEELLRLRGDILRGNSEDHLVACVDTCLALLTLTPRRIPVQGVTA